MCIFEGKMNAPLFADILDKTLVPFICNVYPDRCCLVQDNDSKHCFRMAKDFYMDQDVNWWRTPAESPDLNPIENLWHELKEFIRRKAKPKTKQVWSLWMGSMHFGVQWAWKNVRSTFTT